MALGGMYTVSRVRGWTLIFSTRYGIRIKARRLSLARSSHRRQVSHRIASCAYIDLADPRER